MHPTRSTTQCISLYLQSKVSLFLQEKYCWNSTQRFHLFCASALHFPDSWQRNTFIYMYAPTCTSTTSIQLRQRSQKNDAHIYPHKISHYYLLVSTAATLHLFVFPQSAIFLGRCFCNKTRTKNMHKKNAFIIKGDMYYITTYIHNYFAGGQKKRERTKNRNDKIYT